MYHGKRLHPPFRRLFGAMGSLSSLPVHDPKRFSVPRVDWLWKTNGEGFPKEPYIITMGVS